MDFIPEEISKYAEDHSSSESAVLAELNAGKIPRDRYESFVKLQREVAYLREAGKRAGWQNRRQSDRVAHRAFNKEVTWHKSRR